MPADLVCPDCGATYADRWRCTCGGPLEFAADPQPPGPPEPGALDAGAGLWAFADLLPVERRVSLGEGGTPLVDAPEWDAQFKLEYVFPTGSFKDRGATATLSRAVGLGIDAVVEDSSGNAGTAIATYAARAGIDAEIYVPADVAAGKLRAIERAGAEVVRVEGSRADVTDACVAAVTEGDRWYASHAWRPSFLAGTATVAFEIARDRGWTVPDAVVAPLGHGTLFLGAYRGFRALAAAGWTDSVPRMLAAQATGYAPIAAAVGDPAVNDAVPDDAVNDAVPDDVVNDAVPDDVVNDAVPDDVVNDAVPDDAVNDAVPDDAVNDAADGVLIREPARREAIVAAIRESGGDAVAVDEAATERALDRLHSRGLYVEPTCALAPAALETYRDRGVVADDDDIVVALTGSGLKK